jgi:uncharacterized protein (DUF2141 family)
MRGLLLLGMATAAALPIAGARAQPVADSCNGPAGEVRLLVDVQGVRTSQGLVAVTLYADDSKKFLAKRGSLYVGRAPARAGVTRVCLNLPRPGIYAVAVYHDADGNRHFNRSTFGLPAEAYGFSNNPGTFFGIPHFASVRFPAHAPETTIGVRLKYP